MAATFTAVRGAFTPSLTNDNWILLAGSFARVTRIGWGGRLQQSTAYRTRWCYPSVLPTGSQTQLSVQSSNPAVAQQSIAASAFSTTQPGLPAEPSNLFAIDWNAQGGEGVLALPNRSGWVAVIRSSIDLASLICCRNVVGTDANGSDYWLTWEE